jgi:diaminohydroxyphosphoribosylaminopyrimidine deaminase/5-amino-6-(5-phosphoribosylamino)uracil reductase
MTAEQYLHQAFLLARQANPKAIRPNPFVGAVVVSENGEIVGEGFHQKAGEAHAEVMAIGNALDNGAKLDACTLYVTLEPCSHNGKTPPCTDLILQHRIPKIVIGSLDPNPLVSGAEILRKNGVEVGVHVLPEILALNETFIINQTLKRPKYVLKSAVTLNGKIADRTGSSKWISNEESRNYVHVHLRRAADAILTTAKTIIRDNATMNIRIGYEIEELNLVVFDRNLELLKDENRQLPVFYPRDQSRIFLVTNKMDANSNIPNVETIIIPVENGKYNIDLLNKELLARNICQVLIEAGGTMNAAMMEAKSVDEIDTFVCPRILMDNDAVNQFEGTQIQNMENATMLELLESKTIGHDILLRHKVIH